MILVNGTNYYHWFCVPLENQAMKLWCSNLFFLNDAATTEIYTLSLHDALPISLHRRPVVAGTRRPFRQRVIRPLQSSLGGFGRSTRAADVELACRMTGALSGCALHGF